MMKSSATAANVLAGAAVTGLRMVAGIDPWPLIEHRPRLGGKRALLLEVVPRGLAEAELAPLAVEVVDEGEIADHALASLFGHEEEIVAVAALAGRGVVEVGFGQPADLSSWSRIWLSVSPLGSVPRIVPTQLKPDPQSFQVLFSPFEPLYI